MKIDKIHVQSRAVIIKEGHILLCKTVGLMPDFYFLPGGHIEHGESAKDALIRELAEEVGFSFTISRFLGCMEYSFDPRLTTHAKCHTHEYSFIFETSSQALPGPAIPLKQQEKTIEISWIPWPAIEQIDLRPEPFKTLLAKWQKLELNEALESLMVQK